MLRCVRVRACVLRKEQCGGRGGETAGIQPCQISKIQQGGVVEDWAGGNNTGGGGGGWGGFGGEGAGWGGVCGGGGGRGGGGRS